MGWLTALWQWLFGTRQTSGGVEAWKPKLQELRLDVKRYDANVDAYAKREVLTRETLAKAEAEKVPGHELDRLSHDHQHAKLDYQSYRRQADSIRENITTLANLVRMSEETVHTGSKVDRTVYEAQAAALYKAIVKQKEDIEARQVTDQTLGQVQNYTGLDRPSESGTTGRVPSEGTPETGRDTEPA
jgi:hypothetical protein